MSVRFLVGVISAAVTAVLGVLTVIWPEWIEAVCRVDPDGGDGSLDWAIVALSFTAALTSPLMPRAE